MELKSGTIYHKPPDLSVVVDEDIREAMESTNVFYGDIVNAQLCREIKKLREVLEGAELGE